LKTRNATDTLEAVNLGRNWYNFLTAGRNTYFPFQPRPLAQSLYLLSYGGSFYFIRYVRNIQQCTNLGGFWIAALMRGLGLSLKITVSRDVTSCGLVVIYRGFGENCFSDTSSVEMEVNL